MNKWLITGCAGFIGSNLLEHLLKNDQIVFGLDNFANGSRRNLEEVEKIVGADRWRNFSFIEGDIRNFATCSAATQEVDIVLHQAALGSVPRSTLDPLTSHDVNVNGFLNILKASIDNKVKRLVYASSSTVYGDHPDLPKQESKVGNPLSPYAATKYINELYAQIFSKNYGIQLIGLRYFNVFGRRQSPSNAYAAVIPLWFKAFLNNEAPIIYGDGETTRDFCYVDNAVQMNILCALTQNKDAVNRVYNVACGKQTTLNTLCGYIKALVNPNGNIVPVYQNFRAGDIRHSLANIEMARNLVGYHPWYDLQEGLSLSSDWYKRLAGKRTTKVKAKPTRTSTK